MIVCGAAALLIVATVGCDDGNDNGDTDAQTDTGGADGYPSGMPTIPAEDFVWEGCDVQLPNGPADDCTPSTCISAVFKVEDFEAGFMVEGVQLEVFYNNDVTGTPNLDATNLDETNEDGEVTALVPPGASIAYRVVGGETPLYPPGVVQTSVEYDVPTPDTDGGDIDALSVSQATYSLISTVLGITPDPTKGILAGSFKDCGGFEIEGVVARLYTSSGELCSGANECLDRYFIDDTPAQDQHWSSADGLFGVLQIPTASGYRLELHGIVPGHGCPGDMVVIGEHDGLRIISNAISIVDMLCIDVDDQPWSARCVWE
jgi:hypothetical protein